MSFFNEYPYRNLTDLNLDWLINAIRTLRHDVDDFVTMNAIKYANPIDWSITTQYEKNTVVIDASTGVAYLSVAAVPAGVNITRPEYWTVIFDLSRFLTAGVSNLADSYEANLTYTATVETAVGGWVMWNGTLYEALNAIHIGDRYVPDGNIKKATVEDFVSRVIASINTEIQNRIVADGHLQDNIDAEAQTRQDADGHLQDSIDGLTNSIDGLTNRIDDTNTAIANEVQARSDADTNLQNQITMLRNALIIDVTKNGVIGDGSTDNTSAIQTLLDDYAGIGALYFPSGTYITNTLKIPSNTIIWLDGTLKLKDGANAQLLHAATKENITIFGHGALDGNKSNQVSALAISCILFGDASDTIYNVNNVLVEGITIKNSLYWGACVIGDNCTFKRVIFADNNYMSFIGPNSKHGKFINCTAYGVASDWGLGFYGGVTDGIIDGCIAYNNKQCGLGALSDAAQPTPSKNITITNCYCHDNGGVGLGVGGWAGLGYDFVISNNISKNNGLTIPTIYDCGGIFASFLQRATISNNVIYGNNGANDYGAGVILVGECSNIEIANNSIISNKYGVLLTGAAMVGININNNNIRGAIPVSYTGVTACVDNIINSNIFDVNAAPYIPFSGDAAIHVKDNSNYKTCVYGRISFPVDGIQSTFVITPALIGLKGDIANCVITPIKNYGEIPLIDKGQTLINITYTTAPLAGLGTIGFDYIITSNLY